MFAFLKGRVSRRQCLLFMHIFTWAKGKQEVPEVSSHELLTARPISGAACYCRDWLFGQQPLGMIGNEVLHELESIDSKLMREMVVPTMICREISETSYAYAPEALA